MGVVNKINKLLQTKAAIRQAIIGKGVEVPEDTVFADYPSKINAIESGSGGDNAQYEYWWNIITENNTNYGYLFSGSKLTSLDLSSFDTSQVTNMSCMFYFCIGLVSINFGDSFDTSKVTDMSSMFYYCNSLTELDLSNFDTSKVTNMSKMFYNCNSLTSLDVSNFDTSQVTDMSDMFYNCSKLTELDLSNFNTSNVTTMNSMFNDCKLLTELDLSSFDTSKVTTMGSIFSGCTFTSLDLSNWNVSKVTSVSSAFHNCKALTDFKAPKNINATFNFSTCTNLTHDSLMSIINNLATVTSTKKLTLGATNLAKLTDEEKAIAVNRGWTLA